LGWLYLRRAAAWTPQAATPAQVEDFVLWATIGIVIGGRLGYVLFYKPGYYIEHPVEALMVWRGGMSFHGGFLGTALAVYLFSRARRVPLLAFGDRLACVAPIGLFFGRIANFINGELFGRVSDVSWAMAFPAGGPEPRHPSQLYQAGLEGLLLLAVLALAARSATVRARAGSLSGIFFAGYAVARMIGELFREPDAHLGFVMGGITMGQILSLPMLIVGLALILWPRKTTP
jgi:phosphatidylglycerol---prolipoprotein diacylglyceryl transferase